MAGRRTKITPDIEDYVKQRRRQGLSHRAIQAELTARGTPVSLGAVHKICPDASGLVPVSDAATTPTTTVPTLDGAVPEDADIATLDALEAEWRTTAEQAKAAGNTNAYVALTRLIRDVVTMRKKLRPPPVQRPEDSIDYVRAGEDAADKLHKLLDEALRG